MKASYILCVAVLVGAGCTESVKVINPRQVYLATNLPASTYRAPYRPELGVVRIELTEVTVGTAVAAKQSDVRQALRNHWSDALGACRNFELANRSSGATPDYRIKLALTRLDPGTPKRIDSGGGDVFFAGSMHAKKVADGTLELASELQDSHDAPIATIQSSGKLTYSQADMSHFNPVFSFAETRSQKTPEGLAIRDAMESGLNQVHAQILSRKVKGQ